MHVPASDIARIFFLPNLSENCPRIGVAMNCIKEKLATKKPKIMYPCCKVKFLGSIKYCEEGLASNSGITGISIPKPSEFKTLVKNITGIGKSKHLSLILNT